LSTFEDYYEQLLIHNYTRDIVVVLLEWQGTDE